MAKELSEIEKFYIEKNSDKTDAEIADSMPGVGVKTVAKYKESLVKEVDVDHTTETQEERTDRLGNGPKTGELIARQEGISIMTEEASEVADARAIVKGATMTPEDFEGRNRDIIHKPQK